MDAFSYTGIPINAVCIFNVLIELQIIKLFHRTLFPILSYTKNGCAVFPC